MSTTTAASRGPYAKTARRRAEIIEAATAVFSSRGYHGGSLRDISKQLGLSMTGMIHHFPTKSELLEAVLESADAEAWWFSEFAKEHGVRAAVMRVWENNYEKPEMLRLLAIVASEASAPEHPAHGWFVDRYDRLIALLTELIEVDQGLGRIEAGIDAADSARILVASWDGLQLQWLLRPSDDLISLMGQNLDRLLT